MTSAKRLHDAFDDQVVGYCFDDLSDEHRALFEVHLLTCDRCYREVERLMAGVEALRSGAGVSGVLSRAELIGLMGISGDLDERWAGHGRFVAVVTVGYALLSAEAILTELSYFLDRFGPPAAWTVPVAAAWVATALSGALAVGLRLTRAERSDALLWSAVVLVGSVGLMVTGAYFVLPHEPSILASFAPRTVASATVRNYALYGLPLAVAFVLAPFQFVVALQRELVRGRHANVLKLFARDPLAVTPRGAIFVPARALSALLVVATIYLIVANQFLLDRLVPGAHSELFGILIYARIVGGLSLAGGSLAWYLRMLNEAKREALAWPRENSQ